MYLGGFGFVDGVNPRISNTVQTKRVERRERFKKQEVE